MVKQDVGKLISERVARYIFRTVLEEDRETESLVDGANKITGQLLERAYAIMILMWTIDALMDYQLQTAIYGIALATMGSFEMMSISFLDARASLDTVNETVSVGEKLVQTIFGLGLFFSGFIIQMFAYLFPPLTKQVTWVPTVSPLTSNALLVLFSLPLAVTWFRVKDVVAIFSFSIIAFICGMAAYYINPYFTGLGLLLPVVLSMIGVVNYGIHKSVKGVGTFINRSRGPNEDANLIELFALRIIQLLLFFTGIIPGLVNRSKQQLEGRLPDFFYNSNVENSRFDNDRQSKLSDFYDLHNLEAKEDKQIAITENR